MSLLNETIYVFTNAFKIFIYLRIWYSGNSQSVSFKKSGTFFVIFFPFFRVMPRTIKFNNEFCRCTIKINNIVTNHFLT